jgi:hypothetical protein
LLLLLPLLLDLWPKVTLHLMTRPAACSLAAPLP